MTRVALYACNPSKRQSVAAIEDQFRVCRAQATQQGWKVVGSYKDAAVSGSSVTLRPGMQALLQDARRGAFDTVLVDALERVRRDQEDVATLLKDLRSNGVEIVTLAEGAISELHVGLEGIKREMIDPFGRFLRLNDVEVSVGLKRSKIYELMRAEHNPFPTPIKIDSCAVWIEADIVFWKARRIAEARNLRNPLTAYRHFLIGPEHGRGQVGVQR